MKNTINIYCDESCHLPHDDQKAMVLGSLWCIKARASEHNQAIAELKTKHHLSPFFEIKWSKVSPAKIDFYRELVDYFFPVHHGIPCLGDSRQIHLVSRTIQPDP